MYFIKPIFKIIVLISILLEFIGCGGNKLNITKYNNKINKKAKVPNLCKTEYKSIMPRVAVVNFKNNSTFGKATINNSSKKSSTIIGAGISLTGISAGKVSNSKSTNIKRQIDSKLSESIVPIVESIVLKTGGAILISRTDMDKIDDELKLQDSGLLDQDTIIDIGQNLGAQFLITGSIDNVVQSYSDYSSVDKGVSRAAKNSDKRNMKILSALVSFGASTVGGMKIKTTFTVKIIDIKTSKIILSQNLTGSANIGKIPNPTYDQIIGGIKKGIKEALPNIEEKFSRYFSVKGYITQLRSDGDDIVAQVNIGNRSQVVENQIFEVYSFEENTDPISGKSSCDRLKLPVILKATNQIMEDKTWTTVDGDEDQLKMYQLVIKTNKKAGFEIPKF